MGKSIRKGEFAMIVPHYIFLSSSYTDGTRIALDIVGDAAKQPEELRKILNKIYKIADPEAPVSAHFLNTQSESWESVQKYDPYFEEVACLESVETFAEKIKQDRVLSGVDVAKYILSQIKCTHLSLEKLVYFAYADYLCATSEKLFADKIYAFKYGPVIESVYEAYKHSGYKCVNPSEDHEPMESKLKDPARSRILFAKDGLKKLTFINKTIATYKDYTAEQLVDLTHKKGTPWDKTDSKKSYNVIEDALIQQYHYVEQV